MFDLNEMKERFDDNQTTTTFLFKLLISYLTINGRNRVL